MIANLHKHNKLAKYQEALDQIIVLNDLTQGLRNRCISFLTAAKDRA